MSDINNTKKEKNLFPVIIVVTTYLIYGVAFHLFRHYQLIILEAEKSSKSIVEQAGILGTLGDYIGGLLNPFLAFLSFIALLYTISLQIKELALTRKELTRTATANEEQAQKLEKQVIFAQEASDAQKKTARQQQFDNTFSTLLTEHNRALDNGMLYESLNQILTIEQLNIDIAKQQILSNWHISRYYRTLYQLLKFIVINHPDNKYHNFTSDYLKQSASLSEKSYASLVRATLPDTIILGLAINSCSGIDQRDEYRSYFLLVERFAMLEHLSLSANWHNITESLSINGEIVSTYSKKAFDKNTSLQCFLNEYRYMADNSMKTKNPNPLLNLLFNDQHEMKPNSVLKNFLKEKIMQYYRLKYIR